jgi:hypothetical protein
VGEVVLMACTEWEKGGKKRGSGGDGAAPFYTDVAGEAMEGGWAARGRHMAARRTGGLAQWLDGGSWPAGTQKRRSWAGSGSGESHGRVPSQTREGGAAGKWGPSNSAGRRQFNLI